MNWLLNQEYILIDRIGGPHGQVLGSFFHEAQTKRSEVLVSWTRDKYFLIRPDLTQSKSVLSLTPAISYSFFISLGRISLGLAAFSISDHVIAYCPTEYWDLFLTFFNKKCALCRKHVRVTKILPLDIIRSKKEASAIQFIDKVYIYFWNSIPK